MKNAKNVIIVILIIVVVILGYMLMVTFPKNAEAQCTTKCTDTVKTQVTSAVQQCMSGAQQCQQTLQRLMQIPACASALSQ